MTHEISHLALQIAELVGYDCRRESEPYCYMVDQMMENALECFPLKHLINNSDIQDERYKDKFA